MKKNQPNQKIKVLFRLRSLEMGGVPRVMLDLLHHLPKDKFEMTLMLNLYQGELVKEIPSDIKLIVVEKGKEQMSSNPMLQKMQLGWRRLKLEVYEKFPSLLYALKVPGKYDIEIAAGYAEFDMVLNSPDKASRKIGWFHTDVTYDRDQSRVLNRIENLKKFNHVVFCAKHIRDVIEENYKVTYPHSSIIYNAIHVKDVIAKAKEFEVDFSNYNRPIFCSIGRLHKRKGYDMLLKVHHQLIQNGFYHTLLILGDGEERNNLEQEISKFNLQDSFVLLGTKVNPYPYLKKADFFILPTRSEAYPLVINEALALNKPIISTNVGGIPEMIDNEIDGVLINVNETEMYEAMKSFITNPSLVQHITEGTKNATHKFDKNKIYDQITEVFEQQYQLKLKNERN